MRIRKRMESEAPIINISSLLDVMFILLIFFLATSTFQQEEHDIQVNLPEHNDTGSLSSASKTLVINVRKNGYYHLQNSVKNLDEVKKILGDTLAQNPGQKVLIRGDQEALHGYVAAVVGVCKSQGVKEANIGYQHQVIHD
ncbi:MAG: biopolymer transporter ExbD [Planctomycetota bacterium]